MKPFKNQTKQIRFSATQMYLTMFSVIALIASNLISAQLLVTPFKDSAFFSTMTSAIIIFPITSILSDVFSEVYGYVWSRKVCYISFVANLGVNLVLTLVASFNIVGDTAEAFKQVFGVTSGMGWCVLIASFTAYIVGDLVNDKVFEKMRMKKLGHDGFSIRAVLSSLAGQACDSCIYLPLALVLLPKLFLGFSYVSVPAVIGMIVMQIVLKVLYEIIILPLTNYVVRKVGDHEENLERKYVEG